MCSSHLLSLQTLLQVLVDHFCWHYVREQNVQAFDNCSIGHCSYHFPIFLLFLYCCHLCNCLIHHLCYIYFHPFEILNCSNFRSPLHHCCDSFLYLYLWTTFHSPPCLFQRNGSAKQFPPLLCQHYSPSFSAHEP